MAPIRKGSPEEFWYAALGVNMDGAERNYLIRADAYIQDDMCIYEISGLHGTYLFSVPRETILSTFPQALRQFEQDLQDRDPNSFFPKVYEEWRDDSTIDHESPDRLLEIINEGYARRRQERASSDEVPYGDGIQLEQYHRSYRLMQAKWYWANFAFEFLFFTGLIWFVLWPGIKNKGICAWARRLVTLPLLFYLPVYMGYASYTFTSRGPSGGILYPFAVTIFLGGSINRIDIEIIKRVPRLLEPLSQGIGQWTTLSGRSMPGPTYLLGFGVALGSLVLIFSGVDKFCKHFRNRPSNKPNDVSDKAQP
jgi:hypothetical protein